MKSGEKEQEKDEIEPFPSIFRPILHKKDRNRKLRPCQPHQREGSGLFLLPKKTKAVETVPFTFKCWSTSKLEGFKSRWSIGGDAYKGESKHVLQG